jgi:hypothetical protein
MEDVLKHSTNKRLSIQETYFAGPDMLALSDVLGRCLACSLDMPCFHGYLAGMSSSVAKNGLVGSDGLDLFSQFKDRLQDEDLLLSLMVARQIWFRHNSFLFENVFTPPQQVMCKAKEVVEFFLLCCDRTAPVYGACPRADYTTVVYSP